MKRLLIAGGSHSDIPLIQAAQKLGWHVITSGNRKEDIGHRHSDECHLEDFSDAEAMLGLARRLRIDAICSSANDFSVISSAYVAERLGLPGFDSHATTLDLHHKDRFRAIARRLGLPCPKTLAFGIEERDAIDVQNLAFPLIVKPIDLTGGKGIAKVEDGAALSLAIDRAFAISRAKRIVIEEFFQGTLHSYSSIIQNGRVVFEYADDEFSYLNPYLVSTSTAPASVAAGVLPGMRKATETLAAGLGLCDGILHAQFLANGDEFRIIEYTRRCPGDFYAVPVRHGTGVDHAGLIVAPCLGIPYGPMESTKQQGYFSRHCVMAAEPGTFAGLVLDPEIQGNVQEIFELKKPGDPMHNHLVDKAAIVFLRYDSAEEMTEKNGRINALVRAGIDPALA